MLKITVPATIGVSLIETACSHCRVIQAYTLHAGCQRQALYVGKGAQP